MKKVLFLIHDLGGGGAEKVLVNLVNHLDPKRFDVTVQVLFGGGTNERFLKNHIKLIRVFPRMIPANTYWMKLLTPAALHKLFVKEHYDIEVSYLEGPSARVISGCEDPDTKLVCWIHIEQKTLEKVKRSFRSERECYACYKAFHRIIAVSETVKSDFCSLVPVEAPVDVLYNTVESDLIQKLSAESMEESCFPQNCVKLVGVGTLKQVKGFDRLIRITEKLQKELGQRICLCILGAGPEKEKLETLSRDLKLEDSVFFMGYQNNPYKYIADCDLFVCASKAEGFSTAATEALIVGTPVCTTEVSGMREMLGENEYGLITVNSEEALYQGVKRMLTEPGLLDHYREKALERGKYFSVENTVKAVEQMLESL